MALKTLFIILTIIFLALGENEVSKGKTKKTLEAEKEKSRSANPGQKGSLQKLTSIMNNRTDAERRQNRRRGKDSSFSKIHQMNRHHDDNNMMNDNEGALTTNLKTLDNDTLYDKMTKLRPSGPTYEAPNKFTYPSQATGVFCNFENETSGSNICMWQWNTTVSNHNLGFRVTTGADIVRMNESSRDLKFTGPAADADGNVGGRTYFSKSH